MNHDTLSSEERWNESFDVALANPPFMSPKGGIRPHKRFTISSNRSEVLFVDYIAEHLHPKGKAGIIVPEGIIFQSGKAYKELRKILVENYLYAVVSLPAGVFNPYSGVKTSILLMDKEVSKQRDEILFIKIDNDGYNLGAQRAAVKGSQLEEAIRLAKEFVDRGALKETTIAHLVPKIEIGKNGDYNLSGERYKITRDIDLSEFPQITLGESCKILNGSTPSKQNESYWMNGTIPWFTIQDIRMEGRIITKTVQAITEKALTETSVKLLPSNTVLLCCTASVGEYAFAEIPLTTNQQFNGLVVNDKYKDKLIPRFLFYLSSAFKKELIRISGQTSFNFVSVGVLKTLQIPLPPLSIQEEIVAEIEGYQKIIDGAKAVVANYKPKIEIDPDWKMVELGKVFTKITESVNPADLNISEVNYLGLDNISQGTGYVVGQIKTDPKEIKSTKTIFKRKNILYGKLRPNLNKVYYSEIEGICSTDIFVLEAKKSINPKFYLYHFLSQPFNNAVLKGIRGAQLPRVGYEYFSTLKTPKPSLEIQNKIVTQIEKEQQMVDANKQLIEIFEQKIKDRIAKVWGE